MVLRHGDPAYEPAGFYNVGEAPVRDGRYRHARRGLEGGRVVHGGREDGVGLGEEHEAPAGGPGSLADGRSGDLLRLSALHRRAEQFGNVFEEVDLLVVELPIPLRVGANDAVRVTVHVDDGAYAAYHAALEQQPRALESILGPEVLDHHRPPRDQRVAGL